MTKAKIKIKDEVFKSFGKLMVYIVGYVLIMLLGMQFVDPQTAIITGAMLNFIVVAVVKETQGKGLSRLRE